MFTLNYTTKFLRARALKFSNKIQFKNREKPTSDTEEKVNLVERKNLFDDVCRQFRFRKFNSFGL